MTAKYIKPPETHCTLCLPVLDTELRNPHEMFVMVLYLCVCVFVCVCVCVCVFVCVCVCQMLMSAALRSAVGGSLGMCVSTQKEVTGVSVSLALKRTPLPA